jgi:lysozyme family protein
LLGLPDRPATISNEVIAAVHAAHATTLVNKICNERLRFLRALRTWPTFGTGWSRRVTEVKATALAMADKEDLDV